MDFNAYQAGLVDYVSKRGFWILEKQAKSLKARSSTPPPPLGDVGFSQVGNSVK